MPYLLTGTQSKAADRYAIDVLGIPSLLLMENASACAARALSDRFSPDTPVAACCGVGNNGADGLCMLKLLSDAGFKNTAAVICGREEKETEEFRFQLSEYLSRGGRVLRYDGGDIRLPFGDGALPVLIDAVFGIGLHRPVTGIFLEFLRAMERLPKRFTEAVDVPSGLESDTGEVMGCAVRADLTVTFGCRKTGLETENGRRYAGETEVPDIGIPEEAYRKALREA